MNTPAGQIVLDVRSSAHVPAGQAFEEWEAGMSSAYVPLSVTPVGGDSFHGTVDLASFEDLELSRIRSSAQCVRRTARLIARSEEPFLGVTINVAGQGWLEQGERVAGPLPGEMYLLDTARPFTVQLDGPWERIAARVPMRRIQELTGLGPDRIRTGVPLSTGGAMGLVSRFIRDLSELNRTDSTAASVLAGHGIDLLASAVQLATGIPPRGPSAQVLIRQQVLSFIRRRCTDPALTVEQIALGCAVSRSTLYRLFDSADGVAATLRRTRIDRARTLLRTTGRPLAAVAAASGFASDRQFYRAFKHDTGTTPGEFRARRAIPTVTDQSPLYRAATAVTSTPGAELCGS
ncbi:helix-turn-helix domain-containing protein [Nocardia sp. BMG51109]|uniref:AraC-like ligand-binding domain-containing protein n=1 Tax=Nocardia sp. BMG51109 TaxID=1056816 RepID=UPI0018DC2757|nr:helix-turn-helix domain-containing protein [Nocardia sp. BMG51109]